MIYPAILISMGMSMCLADILVDTTGKVKLKYNTREDGIAIKLVRNGKFQLSGLLGIGKNLRRLHCIRDEQCLFGDNENLSIKPIENGFNITWAVQRPSEVYEDCYDLDSAATHWYGGPERVEQVWPLEKMTIDGSDPYIIKTNDYHAVAEMYWLNSRGTYILINETTPLWVDQNYYYQDRVCFRAEAKAPYINRWRVVLSYILVSLDGPKQAHLNAVNTLLGKPEAHPNDRMIAEPIWTTWAKYKKQIDDSVVLRFANEIRSHGYALGQLEIDDNWEVCYGSQEFDPHKFGAIKNTIAALHRSNWTVRLWVHPFVNHDCQKNSREGNKLDYFVRNIEDKNMAIWWNGFQSHQIDFTKPEATKWWINRLKKLQENIGIDSFKFDGGETNYAQSSSVYVDVEHTPNILSQKYVEACVELGDRIQYRISFRSQRYGKFISMMDKASTWEINSGLPSLITTLLQFNMNGYGMVMPDMIGGNGYSGEFPTGDLFVRWTQANTFMPTMQFSYLPWDFKDDVSYNIEAIVKNYVDLHARYATNIIRAMNQSISNGTPVNPPIWWVDPTDPIALASSDEYLLGEEILVAPVIVADATSRDVYLPKGQWKDGNDGTVYIGPVNIKNYPAPIEVLPYFIKQ